MKNLSSRRAFRVLALALCLALMVAALPLAGLSASAARGVGAFFTSGSPAFVYLVTGLAPEKPENTVKLYQNENIASYQSYTGTYTIPAKVLDTEDLTTYTVTEIGGEEGLTPGALESVPLKGVVLPGTLTAIGARAFANSSLKEMNFPTSVKSLAADAFTGVSLNKLTLDVTAAVTLLSDHSYNNGGALITLPAAFGDLNVSAPLTVGGPVTVTGATAVTNTGVTVAGGSLTLEGPLSGQGVIEVRDGGSFTMKAVSPAFTGSIRLTAESAVFVNDTSAPVKVQNAAGKDVTVYPGLAQTGAAQAPVDPAEPSDPGETIGEAMMPLVTFNAGGQVSVDPTGTLVTIVPEEGYKVENVRINGVDMGAITRYDFGVSALENTVMVTFGKGEEEVGPQEPALPPTYFLDVPSDAPYAESVAFLANNGIFYGVGGNRFAPDQLTTRAMVLTLLKRMEIYGASFTLVPPSNSGVTVPDQVDWYTDALVWAAANGMVNKDFSVFQPNKVITREEVARLLARFTWLRGFSTRVDASQYNVYQDALLLQGDGRNSMVWAVSKGYLSCANNVLDPSAPITRSDMAVLLATYLRNN